MNENFNEMIINNINNVQEIQEEEIIASGCSSSGVIKKLVLNMIAVRELLVECGFKKIIIDTSETFMILETANGKEQLIPIYGHNNDNDNECHDFDDNNLQQPRKRQRLEDDNNNDDDVDNNDDNDVDNDNNDV